MWLPIILSYARKYWWLIAIALALASEVGYIQRLRSDNEQLVIERNNAEAAYDTLKVKYTNDSTVVVGILGVTRTELIGLREKLKLAGTTKAQADVTAKPKPTKMTHTGMPVTTHADTFELQDSVVGPPVDVHATVQLIARPDSSLAASWVWDIRPHPIPLAIDIGCLARYKPEVLVKSLPWVEISQIKAEVDATVCGRETKRRRSPWVEVQVGALYDPKDRRLFGQLEVETKPIWKGFGLVGQTDTPFESAQVGIQRSWGLF